MALAQRTTVTSCLSPSSFRLESKEAELSGWAGSWPALTTAGSMACSTLSMERQERRLGGIPRASAWEADGDTQREAQDDKPPPQKETFCCSKLSLCDTNPHHLETWQRHFRAGRVHLSF